MRIKTYRWYDIALAFLPLCFPLWQWGQNWATDRHLQGHQSSELAEFAVDAFLTFRYSFPIVLATAFVLVYLVKLTKEAAPRRTLSNFLNYLHEKHFPHPDGGRDHHYRISLFVPTTRGKIAWLRYPTFFRKYLMLYARSGDIYPKSEILWSISRSQMGHFDGIAAHAWVTGNFLDIPDLPDYNAGTDAERATYLQRSFLDAGKVDKLNVLSRSYQALVVLNRSSEKVGVLMMECENANGLANLTSQQWNEIAKTLQCLFLS